MARARTLTGSRPVVYAGRFAHEATEAVPGGCEVLGDRDVLPRDLAGALRRATTLVVLDPLSFPFEMIEGEGWSVPMVVVLPPNFEPDTLVALFGNGLLDKLGPFDSVATNDDALWEAVRARYGWGEGRRVRAGGEDPGAVAAEVCDLLLRDLGLPNVLRDAYEEERFWAERGGLAEGPSGALHRRLGFDKAIHRAQRAALEGQLAAARVPASPDVVLDVLEVACGAGRWATSVLGMPGVRYVGAEGDPALLDAARREGLPGARFDGLEDPARLPYGDEGFDVVFAASAMRYMPGAEKAALVSEMWRVAKPGGRILLLEEFVAEARPAADGEAAPRTLPIGRFASVVASATGGGGTLEHVETLRYPHDAMFKSAVLALAKLGVPKTW